LRLAAEQGLAVAQSNLGLMYVKGEGVPRSDEEGAKWLRRAANQGLAVAQNKLGTMYEFGRGVPQDPVSAYMWYVLAAARGDAASAGQCDAIAKKLTPEQLEEARRRAREWAGTHAERSASPPRAVPRGPSGPLTIHAR
jgi:hypothetical protein